MGKVTELLNKLEEQAKALGAEYAEDARVKGALQFVDDYRQMLDWLEENPTLQASMKSDTAGMMVLVDSGFGAAQAISASWLLGYLSGKGILGGEPLKNSGIEWSDSNP